MKTILYKGYHSKQAYQAFVEAYDKNDLIIFLPPLLTDYSFTELLPRSKIEMKGELWKNQPDIIEPNGTPHNQAVAGVFSSGTTKSSKLVLYSKTNLISSCQGIFELFDRDLLKNIFCYPQPFHTFGLTLGYAASHILQLPLKFPEGKYSSTSHAQWLEAVDEGSLTLGTPTHFYDLIHELQNTGATTPSYSCIIGGARVKSQLWKDCQSKLLIQQPSIGYGATEASPGITHLPPGALPKEDGEIGQPLSHVQVDILPSGLQFSGPNLCCAIIEEGVLTQPQSLTLPDIIRIRESDYHWIYETRANWFLNRGGEKFSLEKLETEILGATGIETLCCSLPDDRLGEDLGVLIKMKNPDNCDEIKNKILDCLYIKTDRKFNEDKIDFVVDWPRNQNQKIDRLGASKLLFREFTNRR